jgi:hypothetical protein
MGEKRLSALPVEQKIKLKPGDFFATQNPQGLGVAICLAQCLKSQDGRAEYGHTGVIITEGGLTFEALWKVKMQNLFEAYKGQKVLIARWKGMNQETFQKGYDSIKNELGRIYPIHRLILHALGLARWIHFLGVKVCSEITKCFFVNAGACTLAGKSYYGVTPDNIVDEIRISKHFDIMYEGII